MTKTETRPRGPWLPVSAQSMIPEPPSEWPVAKDADDLRMRVLATVDKAIDEKLPLMRIGQALGIVFKLEIIDVDDRQSDAAKQWRLAVMSRAGHACEKCGATEHLHAHHVESWAENPDRRFDITNGQALCQTCHAKEHPDLAALILAK